jgi:hypothetical protein
MSKARVGTIAVAIWLVCASSARAESVVISGVELQLPANWGQATKGKLTMLAPKKFKGRGIELIPIPQMPEATPEAIGKLLASEKIKVTKVAPLERNGFTGVAVVGQVTTDKGPVDMDVLIVPVKDGAVMITSFIKADQDPVLRQANTDVLLSARVAGPKMSVTFAAPKKGGIPKDFGDAMGEIGGGLDKVFLLPRPLPIHIESCGFINAFYSPKTHSITLCHELWDDLIKLFTDAGMDPAKAEQLTRGTYVFAFFHEFGHALVGELGLPITGKGEDAADEIATLVLSAMGVKGQRAALNAAQWFDTMNGQKGHTNLFWDEHSFDVQRSVAITCLLYGSNAKAYEPLMKAKGIPPQRLARCTRDYGDRLTAWNKLLEPYHRKVAKK